MRIYRVALRNYRVFEGPLEVEIPSGLVGVYGANGAGKSYFIESIPWVLYGRSRTSVRDVRTTGSEGECVCELEFEHEDHLYVVNRSLSLTGTVKARAWVDGDLAADGVKETNRYMFSTLGMDVDSFKASVFAEQKQVAAFSDATPAERQKLVLSLLGITPLDHARDLARSDARSMIEQLKLARSSAPDVTQLEADLRDFLSQRTVVETRLNSLTCELSRAKKEFEQSSDAYRAIQSKLAMREQVIAIGREKRRLLDQLLVQSEAVSQASQRLDQVERELKELPVLDLDPDTLREEIRYLSAVRSEVARSLEIDAAVSKLLTDEGFNSESELADEVDNARQRHSTLERRREELLREVHAVELDIAPLASQLRLAEERAHTVAELRGQASCPACGQILGDNFEWHLSEVRKAECTLRELLQKMEIKLAAMTAKGAELEKDVSDAFMRKSSLEGMSGRISSWRDSGKPSSSDLKTIDLDAITREISGREDNLSRFEALRVRREILLARKIEIETATVALPQLSSRTGEVRAEIEELRVRLSGLPMDRDELERGEGERIKAGARLEQVQASTEKVRVDLVRIEANSEKVEALLAQAQESLKVVKALEAKTDIVGRVGDYLHEFRRSIIATLGPGLCATAASIFSDLTESEYDQLDVDLATWQLRISDAGHSHDLGRFSGSERDLANLAFRIAISEQIGTSFGQQVGLLVLDEVFGPLDDQRRFLMLNALEALRSRFNQVLVVTHGSDVKEQLPSAIEIIKVGGRRAMAQVL